MAVPLLNPYLELYQEVQKLPVETQLRLRKKLIWSYSWAIPSTEAIRIIAEFSPLIEFGAGSGYWSWLLLQAGAKVVSLDREPMQPPRWCEVGYGEPAQMNQFHEHSLLMCWPPLDSSMAFDALTCYQGSTLIYIGEWQGRTANQLFHEKLNSEWELQQKISIPCWPGFTDQGFIFKRNKTII